MRFARQSCPLCRSLYCSQLPVCFELGAAGHNVRVVDCAVANSVAAPPAPTEVTAAVAAATDALAAALGATARTGGSSGGPGRGRHAVPPLAQ